MIKKLKIFSIIASLFLIAFSAQATTIFAPYQLGTATPTLGYLLQSQGTSSFPKWVATSTLGFGSGGGSQTPWVSDIDGGNHSLTNVYDLSINDTLSNTSWYINPNGNAIFGMGPTSVSLNNGTIPIYFANSSYYGYLGWQSAGNFNDNNGNIVNIGDGTYAINATGTSIFNGNVTGTKFITKNGSSSQFVKGDGTLDSSTYLTTSTVPTLQQVTTVGSTTNIATAFNNTLDITGDRSGGIMNVTRAPTGAMTDTIYGTQSILAKKNSTINDGFGVAQTYGILDSSSTLNLLGTLQAIRTGANNSGTLRLTTYNAGTPTLALDLLPAGQAKLSKNLYLGYTASSTDLSSFGQLFVKSTDGNLYYRNATGTETNLIASGSYLNLDQTSPQTAIGTFTFPQIKDSGLTASKLVFTDASKQLTSTGIGSSTQFIMGDGSLNSTTYASTSALSSYLKINQTTPDTTVGTFTFPIAKTTGGANVQGSISGYGGGELILGNAGASTENALSTTDTGSPTMSFDHRGINNTGTWRWRNNGASTERMNLGNTGILTVSNNIIGNTGLTIAKTANFNGTVNFANDLFSLNSANISTKGGFGSPSMSFFTNSFASYPTSTSLRNDSYAVGMQFTVSATKYVRKLGRYWITGNTQDRTIRLWNSSDQVSPMVTATILNSSPTDANGFKWVDITPTALVSGQTYAVAIDETGGQNWKDSWSPSLQSGFTFGAAFSGAGSYPVTGSPSGGTMYSQPAMDYTTTALLPNEGVLNAHGTGNSTTTYSLSTFNSVGSSTMNVRDDGVMLPFQAPTASAPAYIKGGMYFDTTLSKLRVGGASGWETVTSI